MEDICFLFIFVANSNLRPMANTLNIRKAWILVIIFFFTASVRVSAQIRIFDQVDNQPIAKATVIDGAGRVVGMTDRYGILPEKVQKTKGFSVRHIAYETLDVHSLASCDTVLLMKPVTLGLEEINVNSSKLEYLYIREYFRLYQLKDTVLEYYQTGYLDSFVKLKNKRVKEHVVGRKTLYDKDIKLTEDGLLPLEAICFTLIEPCVEGKTMAYKIRKKRLEEKGDSLVSKKKNGNEAAFIHVNRDAGITIAGRDYLAFKGDHQLNIWGLKLAGFRQFNITTLEESEVYDSVEEELTVKDLQSNFCKMEVFFTSKKIKEGVKVCCIGESYVVDRKLLSRERMEELWEKPLPADTVRTNAVVPSMSEKHQAKINQMKRYRYKKK